MQSTRRLSTDYAEDTVPNDFVHYQQWPEYNMPAEFAPEAHASATGTHPVGTRWKIWPFRFELYITDEEPVGGGHGPWAFIQWQRITRTDTPPGWLQLSSRTLKREAFIELKKDLPYWTLWSPSSRQYRNRWRTKFLGSRYSVEEPNFQEFKEAYTASTVAARIGMEEFSILERKWNDPHTRPFLRLFVARAYGSNDIAAGIAILESPTYKSAYYQLGFVQPHRAHDRAMLGLIDYWHEDSHKRGLRFLALGHLWKQGNPLEIKGYSDFKLQFGPIKISFPPTLWRIGRCL